MMNQKYRFHLLGLAHVPTHRDISCCAYTQKILKLSKMLMGMGHDVYFYGGEGSDVECTEFIQVVDNTTRIACYGHYDWRVDFFKHNGNDLAYRTFSDNAIEAINARKKERDFLLVTMGNYQKRISDSVGLMSVESGIGYEGIFTDKRVFESYAWMHYLYGTLNQQNGSWYDIVIPNYFDPADFEYQENKANYFLYIGRLVSRKGIEVAAQVSEKLNKRLVIAGQGSLINETERLYITGDSIDFIGAVGPEERSVLMKNAQAVFVPTYYIEPFGGVAVEAQMCGTPVITTDWGAFSETVVHGKTGYRCRTFDDFIWAAENIQNINPADCRQWAVDNYSMERVAKMYQEYFVKLNDLWDTGWYKIHPERQNLDWLVKYHG